MIEFKNLTQAECLKLFGDMDKVVLEDLYYYLDGDKAPFDYYDADNLVSPVNRYHDEYFAKVKPVAVGLFNLWDSELVSVVAEDDEDINSLKRIGENFETGRAWAELAWHSLSLRDVVIQYLAIKRAA